MTTYTSFQCDERMEQQGIWIDFGDAGRFRLARAGGSNKRYSKKLSRLTKPHRRAIAAQSMDEEMADRIMQEAFVDTVLLGWENVTDAAGEPLSYSRENAMRLFADLPDLLRELMQSAQDSSLYRVEVLENDAGN